MAQTAAILLSLQLQEEDSTEDRVGADTNRFSDKPS